MRGNGKNGARLSSYYMICRVLHKHRANILGNTRRHTITTCIYCTTLSILFLRYTYHSQQFWIPHTIRHYR